MNEQAFSRFLHTRFATVIMFVVAIVMGIAAYGHSTDAWIGQPLGIGITPPRQLIGNPVWSAIVSMLSMAAMGVLIIYINRVYNVLRSLTSLVAGLFFIMMAAQPTVLDRFYGGDLAGVLILLCISLLFACYGDPMCQRRIYLICFLITSAAFTDLSFAVFLPIFLIGAIQMRVFSLRTLLAGALGILTPPWILFGLGIVSPADLHLPSLNVPWSALSEPATLHAFVFSLVTITLGVGFTVANLLKILSYNSRVRAYNGFLTISLIATGVCTLINFNNFAFYIPLLCCLTAYQMGHFFTYRRHRRSYIPILLIIALYFALYLWTFS